MEHCSHCELFIFTTSWKQESVESTNIKDSVAEMMHFSYLKYLKGWCFKVVLQKPLTVLRSFCLEKHIVTTCFYHVDFTKLLKLGQTLGNQPPTGGYDATPAEVTTDKVRQMLEILHVDCCSFGVLWIVTFQRSMILRAWAMWKVQTETFWMGKGRKAELC